MLLIRVIIDLKFNFNYFWDLDEMFYTKQLKDGECNDDNYFSNFRCHAIMRLSIRVLNALDFYLSS